MAAKGLDLPADDEIASIYALVVDNPRIGVPELAGRLDCSQEAIGQLLNRMVELSLLQPARLEDKSFVAKHPVPAIRRMIERELLALDEHWQRLQHNYQAMLSVLPKLAGNVYHLAEHRPPERIEAPEQLHFTVESLIVHAREQILAFILPSENPVCAAVADRMLHVAALRRGLANRVVYSQAGHATQVGLTRPADLQDSGTEIRTVRELPLWLMIVDGTTAVLPTDGAPQDAAALLVRDRGTITALTALFESYWEQGSRPVRSEADPERADCTALDRGILSLLASGQTDEAVARHFDISVRTLRRRVAALMKQVDARSRFELAIEASARGWVKPTSAR